MKRATNRRMKLRTEITLFFSVAFVLAIAILLVCTQVYLSRANEENLELYVTQTLNTVSENIAGRIDNIDHLVEVLLINTPFQNQIRAAASYKDMINLLWTPLQRILLSDMNMISVVYFSARGEYLILNNVNYTYDIKPSVAKSDEWREKLKSGDMTTMLNGGGAATITGDSIRFLSFVREIQRLSDYSRMGDIVINVSCERIGNILAGYTEDSPIEIYMCDSSGAILADSGNATQRGFAAARRLLSSENAARSASLEGMVAYTVRLSSDSNVDLSFVGVAPAGMGTSHADYFFPFMLFVGIVVTLLIFLGQIYITGMISAPLEEMTRYMSQAGNANFVTIPIRRGGRYDEIGNLQTFFNQMITSMGNLIKKIGHEEQIKRSNEIALLQAQIKPHFLYNALDAVSALSLIGDNETAYKLTQALGAYYRTSLSGGREVVDIRTELDCVKNYVTVLNIRYGGKIQMSYDVPEELMGQKVLKLILQPLIENSVYHGIRNRHGPGHISVTAGKRADRLVVAVEDDGVGMTPERIAEVITRQRRSNNGFGIYNLIEKIRIFYGIEDPVAIESTPGAGTKIIISLGLL